MAFTTYELIYSDRTSISLQIRSDGTVLVRAPKRMSQRQVDAFVESKKDWLTKHLQRLPSERPTVLTQTELEALKKQAKSDLESRVKRFAPLVDVTYGRVTVRAQKTRWGSCSAKGNLNFNCLLMLTPDAVRDYVVVHELCHRRHLDHSASFWAAVSRVMPNWQQHRRWLREHGGALMMRLP